MDIDVYYTLVDDSANLFRRGNFTLCNVSAYDRANVLHNIAGQQSNACSTGTADLSWQVLARAPHRLNLLDGANADETRNAGLWAIAHYDQADAALAEMAAELEPQ